MHEFKEIGEGYVYYPFVNKDGWDDEEYITDLCEIDDTESIYHLCNEVLYMQKNVSQVIKNRKNHLYRYDGVLCDYGSLEEKIAQGMNKFQVFKIKGSFENLKPIQGVGTINLLVKYFDVSTHVV